MSVRMMMGSVTAPSFVPTDIAGCCLWLDASQITGHADGATVGFTGDPWLDLSGQGNNAGRSTSTLCPLYKTNILNGMPVVRFDGVDDQLLAAVSGNPGNDNFCMWAVVSNRALGTTRQNFLYRGTPASNGYGMAVRANAGKKGGLLGGVAWLDGTQNEQTGFEVYVMQRRSGRLRIWVDGDSPVVNTTTTPVAPTGAVNYVGHDGINNPADVDIAEIGIHNGATSITDAGNLGSYLATKWGLTWSAASDS